MAVLNEDNILGEALLNTKNTHSEKLLILVKQLLDELKLTINDIDIISVAQGPGSFTGLRIGMATAKGLAQGAGKRLIAVPSLDALAHQVIGFEGIVCPILNAKKNEVYTALYCRNQQLGLKRFSDYLAIKPQLLVEELKKQKDKVIFLGDGVGVYREMLIENLNEQAVFAPIHLLLPRAASIGALALERAKCSDYDDLYQCPIIYIRKSEAEVQWEMKHGRTIDQ